MPALAWTIEHEQILRQMWPTHSVIDIVTHLETHGRSFTRNAIIGKAHRLKLPENDRRHRTLEAPAIGVTARPRKTGPVPQVKPPAPPPKPVGDGPLIAPVKFVPRVIDTGPLQLTLLQLTEATCKYPTGGEHPDFTFCGHASKVGPYCMAHARICYAAPADRKARAA